MKTQRSKTFHSSQTQPCLFKLMDRLTQVPHQFTVSPQKLKIILGFFSFKKVRSGDVPPDMSLAHFIRDQACLKGTKISCNQGGCGACVVTASLDGKKPVSVNSVSFFRVTLSINVLVVSFNREASKVRGPFYLLF